MVTNKVSILGLVLFCSTLLLNAQVDSKYLAGAVPEVDGKVILTREIRVDSSVSKSQLFDLVKEWMEDTFKETEDSRQRILFEDKAQDYIVAQGDEHLVFKDQALSYDHAIFTYQLTAKIENELCKLEMARLRYNYEDYKRVMPAEEMITDKVALHKKGDKLNRHYNKFRIKTIDRMDALRASLLAHLSGISVEKTETPTTISIVETSSRPVPPIKVEGSPAVSVAQPMPVPVEEEAMAGYKTMKAEDLTENIEKMFNDSWVVVTIGSADKAKSMIAAWNGMGEYRGKPAPTILVKSGNNKEDKYTISFYTQIHKDELDKIEKGQKTNLKLITTPSGAVAYAEAWMIIECEKIIEQAATTLKPLSKDWGDNAFDKQFVGEILNIWAR